MHRIQKHTLSRLIATPDARYADLKPASVEGNQFMYHLRQLIADGTVEKTTSGRYRLTPKGQLLADRLDLKTFVPRAEPTTVLLIAVKNAKGEWLLLRRKRQPMLGRIGFAYGKPNLGEPVAAAANRELEDKTGIKAELTHVGDGYSTIYENGEPSSQIFFHLFVGANASGKLKANTPDGRAFWKRIDQIAPSQLIPTMPDLLRLIDEHRTDRFFAELRYDEDIDGD